MELTNTSARNESHSTETKVTPTNSIVKGRFRCNNGVLFPLFTRLTRRARQSVISFGKEARITTLVRPSTAFPLTPPNALPSKNGGPSIFTPKKPPLPRTVTNFGSCTLAYFGFKVVQRFPAAATRRRYDFFMCCTVVGMRNKNF